MTLIIQHVAQSASVEVFTLTVDGVVVTVPASESFTYSLEAENVTITRTGGFTSFTSAISTPTILCVQDSVITLKPPVDHVPFVLCCFLFAWLFSLVLR